MRVTGGQPTQAEVFGERFELFPQRAAFWPAESILLVADLHLGKINHFRRSGIALPTKPNERNIELLIDLIQATKPLRVICAGDLFHSHYNPEWEVFGEVVKHFNTVSFELVMGNHDIMSDLQYLRKGIVLHNELIIGKFILTHHPQEDIPEGFYNIAGHIHPGVYLRGKGRQSIMLPCFYFGQRQGLLPAFGMFTGLARITPHRQDKVFAIVDDKILEVN